MFFDASDRTSMLSTGLLILTAAGVAIASDDVRETRADVTDCVAVVTAMEQAAQLDATEERLDAMEARLEEARLEAAQPEATMPARPAPIAVEAPEFEDFSMRKEIEAPALELREPELPRPTLRLDEADELFLGRILSTGMMPARPAPIEVEAPDVQVESLREGLEVPELREPPAPEKPDIQH